MSSTSHTRYACPIEGCNQTFARPADRTRHQNEKHGALKPCPVPGCTWKKSKRKGRLEAHMKKHHGEIYNVELDTTPLSAAGQASTSNYRPSQDYQGSYYQSSGALPASTTYDYQPTYSPAYYQTTTTSAGSYPVGNQLQGGTGSAAAVIQTSYATADNQAAYNTAGPSQDQQNQGYYDTWSPESTPPA